MKNKTSLSSIGLPNSTKVDWNPYDLLCFKVGTGVTNIASGVDIIPQKSYENFP